MLAALVILTGLANIQPLKAGPEVWAPPNSGSPNPNTSPSAAYNGPPRGAVRFDPNDTLDNGWREILIDVVRQCDPQMADEVQKAFDEQIVNLFRWPDDGTPAPNGRSNVGSKCVGIKAKNDVTSQAATLVHEWRHIREG